MHGFLNSIIHIVAVRFRQVLRLGKLKDILKKVHKKFQVFGGTNDRDMTPVIERVFGHFAAVSDAFRLGEVRPEERRGAARSSVVVGRRDVKKIRQHAEKT